MFRWRSGNIKNFRKKQQEIKRKMALQLFSVLGQIICIFGSFLAVGETWTF